MHVARLRHIQSVCEPDATRNPDTAVRYLLPFVQRWRLSHLDRGQLAELRSDPFYYYLVARTRHYDTVFGEAVSSGIRRIVNIGSGSDTRAYRFRRLLRSKGVTVLECDQSAAIREKERLLKNWREMDHLQYLPIDLNDEGWPDLQRFIDASPEDRTLVLMEGVSAYVDQARFRAFLELFVTALKARSVIAYDFKIGGVNDAFGEGGRTVRPFRLSPGDAAYFHEGLGFQVDRVETSAELCSRLLPSLPRSNRLAFGDDCLVQLAIPDAPR